MDKGRPEVPPFNHSKVFDNQPMKILPHPYKTLKLQHEHAIKRLVDISRDMLDEIEKLATENEFLRAQLKEGE